MSQIAVNVRKATAADAYIPLDMAEHQRRLRGRVKTKSVPYSVWWLVAREEAKNGRVPCLAVVGHSRHWAAVLTRWRSWKRVLDSDADYSIASLATISGFDHTTILHGLKRLADGACEHDRPTAMPPPAPATPIRIIPLLVPKR